MMLKDNMAIGSEKHW